MHRLPPLRASGLPGRCLALVGAALAVLLPAQLGAVSVSPSAIYITHETRSANLTLRNPGDRPVEVTIGFVFGYPQNNAAGNIHVPLHEVVPAGEPSAAEWLRAFPRQIRLEPGQRQVVRVLASPPGDLADGEYWARVVISSRGGQPPIEQVSGGRSVRLDVETVLVLPATYRQGTLSTGLSVRGIETEATEEGLHLRFDLERQGEAAYIGLVRAELVGPGGRILAEASRNVAVYRELVREMLLPWPDDPDAPEAAEVRYRFVTDRPDLPPGGPLQAPEIRGSIRLVGTGPAGG